MEMAEASYSYRIPMFIHYSPNRHYLLFSFLLGEVLSFFPRGDVTSLPTFEFFPITWASSAWASICLLFSYWPSTWIALLSPDATWPGSWFLSGTSIAGDMTACFQMHFCLFNESGISNGQGWGVRDTFPNGHQMCFLPGHSLGMLDSHLQHYQDFPPTSLILHVHVFTFCWHSILFEPCC